MTVRARNRSQVEDSPPETCPSVPPTHAQAGRHAPPGKLRAVAGHVEEHLEASLTLGQLAAVAHLSVYHFARQFWRATGLPPHQYVIARHVERAKQLLQGDLSCAVGPGGDRAGSGKPYLGENRCDRSSLEVVSLHQGAAEARAGVHLGKIG